MSGATRNDITAVPAVNFVLEEALPASHAAVLGFDGKDEFRRRLLLPLVLDSLSFGWLAALCWDPNHLGDDGTVHTDPTRIHSWYNAKGWPVEQDGFCDAVFVWYVVLAAVCGGITAYFAFALRYCSPGIFPEQMWLFLMFVLGFIVTFQETIHFADTGSCGDAPERGVSDSDAWKYALPVVTFYLYLLLRAGASYNMLYSMGFWQKAQFYAVRVAVALVMIFSYLIMPKVTRSPEIRVYIPGTGVIFLMVHGSPDTEDTIWTCVLDLTTILFGVGLICFPAYFMLEVELLHGHLLKNKSKQVVPCLYVCNDDSLSGLKQRVPICGIESDLGSLTATEGGVTYHQAYVQITMWNTFKGDMFQTVLIVFLYTFVAIYELPKFQTNVNDNRIFYTFPPCAAIGLVHIALVFLIQQLMLILPLKSAIYLRANKRRVRSTPTLYVPMETDTQIDLSLSLRRSSDDLPRMNAQLVADCLCAADTWNLENHTNHTIWSYLTWGRGRERELLEKYAPQDDFEGCHPNVQTKCHKEFGEAARPSLPIEQYVQLREQTRDLPFYEFHMALWRENCALGIERKDQQGDCWVLAFQVQTWGAILLLKWCGWWQGCDNVKDYLCASEVAMEQFDEYEGELVHSGFLTRYRAVKPHFLRLMELHGATQQIGLTKPLVLTGHSMGGAVAALAARDFLHMYREQPWVLASIVLVTFGCPRVGCSKFAKATHKLYNYVRVVHQDDIVPRLPPNSMCDWIWMWLMSNLVCVVRRCFDMQKEGDLAPRCSDLCTSSYSHGTTADVVLSSEGMMLAGPVCRDFLSATSTVCQGVYYHHLIHYYEPLHNWIAHMHPDCNFLLRQLVNSRARPVRPGAGCLMCNGTGARIGHQTDKSTIYNDIQLTRYARAFNMARDFDADATEPNLTTVGIVNGAQVDAGQESLHRMARKFGAKLFSSHVALFTILADSDEPKQARVATAVEAMHGFKEGCDNAPNTAWEVASATMYHLVPAESANGCCVDPKKVGGLSRHMKQQLIDAGVFTSDCENKDRMVTVYPCATDPLETLLSVCDYVLVLGATNDFKERIEEIKAKLSHPHPLNTTGASQQAEVLWVPDCVDSDQGVSKWLQQGRGLVSRSRSSIDDQDDQDGDDHELGLLMSGLRAMDSHIESLELREASSLCLAPSFRRTTSTMCMASNFNAQDTLLALVPAMANRDVEDGEFSLAAAPAICISNEDDEGFSSLTQAPGICMTLSKSHSDISDTCGE